MSNTQTSKRKPPMPIPEHLACPKGGEHEWDDVQEDDDGTGTATCGRCGKEQYL